MNRINSERVFRLAEHLNYEESSRIEKAMGREPNRVGTAPDVMAQWDGKPRRPVKAGEWYLSGAYIEAYRAPNDLSTPYHIAKLVEVRRVHLELRTVRVL